MKDSDSHVLMSMVSGDAVEKLKTMTEEEVIDKCLAALRKIFPNQVGSWLVWEGCRNGRMRLE